MRRDNLQGDRTPDSVVFPHGVAKTLGDCSREDLEWLEDAAEQRLAQAEAWLEWWAEQTRAEKGDA